jgi:vancomycin resistance protein VanW
VGCSIVYNYVDLVVRNDTDHPFQLRARVGERYLHGQLRTDVRPEHTYEVEARGEQFLRQEGRVYRRNQIWRRVIDRVSGDQVGEELLKSNCALVVYEPAADVTVIDLPDRQATTRPRSTTQVGVRSTDRSSTGSRS